MQHIKDTNFYCVHGWMLRLGLVSNELPVYAIIYGFTQDGKTEFSGSLNYLAEFANCTQRTVQTTLKNLEQKGFITKRSYIENNIKRVFYKVTPTIENFSMVQKKFPEGIENFSMGYGNDFQGGIENFSTNNKHIYITNNEQDNECCGTTSNTPSKSKVVRKKYGPHQNLLLTDDEVEQLKRSYPDDWERYIEEASNHLGPSERKSKAYKFVNGWGARDYQRLNRGKNTKPKTDKPAMTVEAALAKLVI